MSLIFHIVTRLVLFSSAFDAPNAHNVWNILESMQLFHDTISSYLFRIKPFQIDRYLVGSELTNGKLFADTPGTDYASQSAIIWCVDPLIMVATTLAFASVLE